MVHYIEGVESGEGGKDTKVKVQREREKGTHVVSLNFFLLKYTISYYCLDQISLVGANKDFFIPLSSLLLALTAQLIPFNILLHTFVTIVNKRHV